MRLFHCYGPVFDDASRVLVLGSFPSVLSRENGFFYGHPHNRFWPVLAAVFGEPVPKTIEEKTTLLLRNGVALWDVIESCEITGSSDASIKNVVVNDIPGLLKSCPVARIFANGGTSAALYKKHVFPKTRQEICRLPSTSPANASWSLERLISAWKVIAE